MSLGSVLNEVETWRAEGRGVALATVVATWGSAPRRPGSVLAVAAPATAPSASPTFAGSVSGGCVEAAVVGEGLAVLADHRPRRLVYGVSDADAMAVGLACGGTLEVFVEELGNDPATGAWLRATRAYEPCARVVPLEEGAAPGFRTLSARHAPPAAPVWTATGTLGDPDVDAWADDVARAAVAEGASGALEHAGRRWLVHVETPPERLVIVGGGDIAAALALVAGTVGFRVAVVDPRAAFVPEGRFGMAEIVVDWPTAETLYGLGLDHSAYLVTLAHDPKIDELALRTALEARARYVGALGGRKTHAARAERLSAAGVSAADLGTIRAPVGLDIGAVTPAEIAVGIVAQLVAARRGAL